MELSKWDRRFMELAKMVSTWSKDPSTQTGAVLVSPDRKHVVLGYNGFPARMSDAQRFYDDRELKYSRIVHCEMNAMMNAGGRVDGYTLYTYPFLSCDRCAAHMIAAGIVRAVGPKPSSDAASRWEAALHKTRAYFNEAGVEVLEYES